MSYLKLCCAQNDVVCALFHFIITFSNRETPSFFYLSYLWKTKRNPDLRDTSNNTRDYVSYSTGSLPMSFFLWVIFLSKKFYKVPSSIFFDDSSVSFSSFGNNLKEEFGKEKSLQVETNIQVLSSSVWDTFLLTSLAKAIRTNYRSGIFISKEFL